jgi:hypothetical protein
MTDHRLAWLPRRYTSTAVPRRTHTERPLSALVRVITRSRGAGPWQAPARRVPGGGGGVGELAEGGDDAPAGSGEGALACGWPAGAPGYCWPQPEITATAPRATAASTGTLRMIAPSGAWFTSPGLDAGWPAAVPGDHGLLVRPVGCRFSPREAEPHYRPMSV